MINKAAFVAPTASILGAVNLGKDTSVWYGAMIRGTIHSVCSLLDDLRGLLTHSLIFR